MIRWTPDGRPPRRGVPASPGLVLDRDGCLTVEEHHLTDPTRLAALPGARDAVRRAASAGRRIAVVTNQSVVGRGMVTPATMVEMHQRLVEIFPDVEVVYHCPHRPEAGCPCRKPLPMMPRAALDDLGLDPERTVLVGDKSTDLEAGRAAGLDVVLVRTGHGEHEAARVVRAGLPVVDTLADAVARLVASS